MAKAVIRFPANSGASHKCSDLIDCLHTCNVLLPSGRAFRSVCRFVCPFA